MRVAIPWIVILSALSAFAQNPPSSIVVEGRVAKPGVYPIQTPNTVMIAIAQAGGLIQYADHKAFIIRLDDQGVAHAIPVPLWDILNRKKPDIALQSGDILQVPDRPRRQIAPKYMDTPNILPIGRPAA
jgi:protein involved in polysaccharide export with SLBB domain